MKKEKTEHDKFLEKRSKGMEIGKLLPEVKEKVTFYSDIIEAESNLIDKLEKRQSKMFVSSITKAKEKAEIIKLRNSVIQKQKVFDSYLTRKAEYEKWLEEMAIEVNSEFENIKSDARDIPYAHNPRLQEGINQYEAFSDKNTFEDKVQMYLFIKNECLNYYKNHPKPKKIDAVEEKTEKEASPVSHLKIEKNEEAIAEKKWDYLHETE